VSSQKIRFIIHMVLNSHILLSRTFCSEVLDFLSRGYGRKAGFLWGFFWITRHLFLTVKKWHSQENYSGSFFQFQYELDSSHQNASHACLQTWNITENGWRQHFTTRGYLQALFCWSIENCSFLKTAYTAVVLHNSGSFIPAANALSFHPFATQKIIYLTSKICVSLVTLFCKSSKTCLRIF